MVTPLSEPFKPSWAALGGERFHVRGGGGGKPPYPPMRGEFSPPNAAQLGLNGSLSGVTIGRDAQETTTLYPNLIHEAFASRVIV